MIKTIPPHYIWGTPAAHTAIQENFAIGKAILTESDTVWGLCTPATIAGARILDQLKKRRDKPYVVIIDSLDTVEKTVIFPENGSYALAKKGWPGPLTLLLPARPGQLYDAQSPTNAVGIRVPHHGPLQALAAVYGGLYSTSANISGDPVPLTYEQLDPSIQNAVGAVIYNGPDYKPALQPSTIVDCTGTKLKVIRYGAYPILTV